MDPFPCHVPLSPSSRMVNALNIIMRGRGEVKGLVWGTEVHIIGNCHDFSLNVEHRTVRSSFLVQQVTGPTTVSASTFAPYFVYRRYS